MTTLLFLGTPADEPHLSLLAGLAPGVQWKQKLTSDAMIAEIETWCEKAGVTGVICSNAAVLRRLLESQHDFAPPNNRRGLTLDDYQGSLISSVRKKLPFVFINPLENLRSQPHATPAAKRFISKLSRPGDWYAATDFSWNLAAPDNLDSTYNRWMESASIISIDIETMVDDPHRRINCVGYCAYFPDTHTTECIVIPFNSTYNLTWVRKFNRLPQPKIFQNGLYDNAYFLRYNCPVYNWLYDTQHLFHSMYSEYPKRLDFITAYAVRDVRYWKDDGKSGNLEDYYRYNARDCWATLNAFLSLMLDAEPYAISNYVKEFPLVFPCLTCELEGLAVDMARMKVVKQEKELDIAKREERFRVMIAAPGFNVNSPPQVKSLMKVCGLNLPSADAANMLVAQASHPLNNRIFTELSGIKKQKKLISTYFVEEKFWNGRLLYKLNPAGTDTGRLASAESSFWCGLQIQNIPRGDSVKQCILSDPGWLLCEIDKAQSEARCVGYLAGETSLIELVEGPHDYHSWNAAAFFGVPYEKIYNEALKKTLDKDLRDLAKRTNHGANYNMGANVMLATMGPAKVAHAKMILKLPAHYSLVDTCKYMLSVYEKTYPRVKGLWYDSIIKEISLTGKLVSPRGWTRVFFGRPSRANKPLLNAAVAHPAQNLSVDIINDEFYNVWNEMLYGKFRNKIRIKAQIHDSIFFQYREEYPEIPEQVCEMMNTAVRIKGADGVTRTMRIPSDISAGKRRWSELK